MKVLFVCWANVGRSQMAAELYNKMTGTRDADSAGTQVSRPGKTLQERRNRRGGTFVIDVMREEEDIDISQNTRTQLAEQMLSNYDLVINMAQPEYTPEWLKNHPNYTYWPIDDPGGNGKADTIRAKSEITEMLKQLLSK